MDKVFTRWRLRVYPRCLLIALFVPIVVSVLSADGSAMITGRLGGDFPAFYGAGAVVEQGQVDELYDWQVQADAQDGLFGDDEGVFQVFAYPPFVAHVFSFLARLPYPLAYFVFTSVMFLAIAFTIIIIRRFLDRVDRWPVEAFALAAAFYPLYRAATGGQNSALSLLILAGVFWALRIDRPVLAGLIMGLLLYKPQLALPGIGLLAIKDWRSTIGVAASAAFYWLWGAWLGGAGWVRWWAGNINDFNAQDQEINGANSINLVGFAERFLGIGSIAAYTIGGVLALILTVALIRIWADERIPLDLQIAALVCGMLLIPLHVMFYDAGLLVLPFAILGNRHGRDALPWLTVLVALGLLGGFAMNIGFSPLFLCVVLTGVWIVRDIATEYESKRETAGGPPDGRNAGITTRAEPAPG